MLSIWGTTRKLYMCSGLSSKSLYSPLAGKTEVLNFTYKTQIEPKKPYEGNLFGLWPSLILNQELMNSWAVLTACRNWTEMNSSNRMLTSCVAYKKKVSALTKAWAVKFEDVPNIQEEQFEAKAASLEPQPDSWELNCSLACKCVLLCHRILHSLYT